MMEKEYKYILSHLIKANRLNNNFSLAKFALANDVSLSTLYRIENNPDIVSDSVFEHVSSKLNIPIPTELNDKLFVKLYKSIIDQCDATYVSSIWSEIETNIDLLLGSPFYIRYHLYQFVYLQYIEQNSSFIDKNEINYLLKNVNKLIDYDKAVLFDALSTYYYFLNDYEKMRKYFSKMHSFKEYELPYGRYLYHVVEDYAYLGNYIDAIDCSREAMEIFDKYNLIKAKTITEMNIGNIYSLMGKNDKALDIFLCIYNLGFKELKAPSLNNIVLSYVLLNDYKNFLKYISRINKVISLELNLSFYEFTLKFMLSNKDLKRFDLWYKKSKECPNRDKLHSIIIEFYNSYRHGCINEELGEEALSLINSPHNRNEFVSVSSILLNLYDQKGETKKYKILNNKLKRVVMNETTNSLFN